MALGIQIESAAAAGRQKKRVVGGTELRGHHLLPLEPEPRTPEERLELERRRWKAAHVVVRFGRTPDDPNADVLLEICGLTHDDGIPETPTKEIA